MISDLQTTEGCGAMDAHGQIPESVRSFAVPDSELPLLHTLSDKEKDRVLAILEGFQGVSLSKDVKGAVKVLSGRLQNMGFAGVSPSNLRAKYYEYGRCGNWKVIANKARARELAQQDFSKERNEFICYWRKLGTGNKRKYAPAWRSLIDKWKVGGSIPGWGTWREHWAKQFPDEPVPMRFPALFPMGMSYRNMMERKNKPTKAQELAAREGIAAARNYLPHVKGTREGLRFLEVIEFDDLKCDFRVIAGPAGKQKICDLWLLIARDKATNLLLGYGMRPALPRDDGKQDHLKLRDMKQLAGWILSRYGLPVGYTVHWKVERGTATFPAATAAAIQQLSSGSIEVHYSSMITGTVMPGGFKDKAVGNSRGKASLESGNNLIHNECGDLPGQTGPMYQRRPAELVAREKECLQLMKDADGAGPEVYDQIQFPLLTLKQAREKLNQRFNRMNDRTKHALEGFEEVVIWRDSLAEDWKTLSELPQGATPAMVEMRKESPMERMRRLVSGVEFRPVHPALIFHFYEDSHKEVTVNKDGEISFVHEGRDHTFMAPHGQRVQRAGEKFLAYFHANELDFLHLTKPAPHNGYVTTWVKRHRVRPGDNEALAAAIRYCKVAQETELDELRSWHADAEITENARRAHNAALLSGEQSPLIDAEDGAMIEVTPSPTRNAEGGTRNPEPVSPVLAALEMIHVEQSKDAATRQAVREVDVTTLVNEDAAETPKSDSEPFF